MKKLLLLSTLAISLFAQEPKLIPAVNHKADIERLDSRLKQIEETLLMQEKVNTSQLDTNEIKRRVDDSQNETIKLIAQQLDLSRSKFNSLESIIDKQQAYIKQLESRISTLERKVK